MSSTAMTVTLLIVLILLIAGGMALAFLIDRRRNQAVAHDQERFEEQPDASASSPTAPATPGTPKREA